MSDLRALLSNNKYDAMHALARDVYWGRGHTETASLRMAVDAALTAVLPDLLDEASALRAEVKRLTALVEAVREVARDVATDAGDDKSTYGEDYHAGMVTVAARITQALAFDGVD